MLVAGSSMLTSKMNSLITLHWVFLVVIVCGVWQLGQKLRRPDLLETSRSSGALEKANLQWLRRRRRRRRRPAWAWAAPLVMVRLETHERVRTKPREAFGRGPRFARSAVEGHSPRQLGKIHDDGVLLSFFFWETGSTLTSVSRNFLDIKFIMMAHFSCSMSSGEVDKLVWFQFVWRY